MSSEFKHRGNTFTTIDICVDDMQAERMRGRREEDGYVMLAKFSAPELNVEDVLSFPPGGAPTTVNKLLKPGPLVFIVMEKKSA